MENQLPTDAAKDDAYRSALLLTHIRIFPEILKAAIDLNLFEIIAKSSSCGARVSATEIASQSPNQHPELANRLERMLPSLAAYSLLTCSTRRNEDGKNERVYALSPVGEYFASDKDGGSLAPLTTLVNREYYDIWKNVKDAIVDNTTHFEKVYGMPLYQYIETDKELSHTFNKAMAHGGPLQFKKVLEIYKGFEGVSSLVDVGGGIGASLKLIISKYPSIKGINFDLPLVVQNAPPYPGIEHIGGDMFESVPTGDAIILKQVCHNWSDENCVKVLRNCHKALPQHGKVILLEIIMPEAPNSSIASQHACLADSLMFVAHGGKERTEKELESLCRASGFSKFHHLACGDFMAISGVIELYK